MQIGIGILSYNRPDSLSACLESLFNNLTADVKVAVNCDLWNAEIQASIAPFPVWALQGEPQGIPYANNRLLHFFENFDAVFLVQDDIRFLRPAWLERYLNALQSIPYLSFFDTYYPEDQQRPRHYKVNLLNQRKSIQLCGTEVWLCRKSPQGAFQALSRKCIETVGDFDTGFGVYGFEHHDYWQRTCNAGFAPQDHFYDVKNSEELIKIDWEQPPSLSNQNIQKANKASKIHRNQIYVESNEGLQRIQVIRKTDALKILQTGAPYIQTDAALSVEKDLLKRPYWLYPTRLPVFAYHAVDDALQDRYTVSVDHFRQQIAQLCQHFEFISLNEAITRPTFKPGQALLTFDDGYQCLNQILPVLAQFNAPAVIFVPVEWVGKSNHWDHGAFVDRRHLSWEELRHWISSGHAIGSHGISHNRLTRLSLEQLDMELKDSQQILEENLHQPIRTIAYPFGSVNEQVIKNAARYYDAGFSAGRGNFFDWDSDRFQISRITVHQRDTTLDLLKKVADYMMQAPMDHPVWSPTKTGTGSGGNENH